MKKKKHKIVSYWKRLYESLIYVIKLLWVVKSLGRHMDSQRCIIMYRCYIEKNMDEEMETYGGYRQAGFTNHVAHRSCSRGCEGNWVNVRWKRARADSLEHCWCSATLQTVELCFSSPV